MNSPKHLNRRQFLAASAALSAASFLPVMGNAHPGDRIAGKIKGLNLGVITYSFRSMPGSAEDLLKYLTQLELGSVELMSDPAEAFAGAPKMPRFNRRNMTDEQRAEMKKVGEEIAKWRLKAPMAPYKKLRKMYNDAGVNIDIIKFGSMNRMSPEEINYCFKVAETLGANGITIERSDKTVEKLTPFADKHERMIGYHNHAKVNFNSWDQHVKDSKYNALNLDVGHYVAGTNESPIPLIKKYHNRILGLHLKDRKQNNGPNMPWGEGDTPLGDILRLLRDEQYGFIAAIELEYKIPDGSDAVKEVQKCINFCKEAVG